MIFDEVKQQIDDGIKGLNKGIPMGYERLSHFIPGIQRGTYYLVAAEMGVGKTAWVDNSLVYNPIETIMEMEEKPDFHVLYFSLEIDKVRKIAKAIARRIFHKYKILVDSHYVLSKGKNHISDEVYKIVMEESEYFYRLEEYITFYDKPINPTGIYFDVYKYSKENGAWTEAKNSDNEYAPVSYRPNNPNKTTLIVVDHIGLMRNERGFTKKQNIDKLSEYGILFRNKCAFSPVFIQQLNRSMSSSERFAANRVEPQLSDCKDSSNTQEDL